MMCNRRTHSVHETPEEAKKAAYQLGRLMNGVPFGYVFAIMPKLGKWAFISYKPPYQFPTPTDHASHGGEGR